MDAEVVSVLRAVFEATTAGVMTSPSLLSHEKAAALADDFPVEDLMGTVGAVAGDAMAAALEAEGMRPADYAFSPAVVAKVAERLAGYLRGAGKDKFAESFRAAMGRRG